MFQNIEKSHLEENMILKKKSWSIMAYNSYKILGGSIEPLESYVILNFSNFLKDQVSVD